MLNEQEKSIFRYSKVKICSYSELTTDIKRVKRTKQIHY